MRCASARECFIHGIHLSNIFVSIVLIILREIYSLEINA